LAIGGDGSQDIVILISGQTPVSDCLFNNALNPLTLA
jgi:hypothetical protein